MSGRDSILPLAFFLLVCFSACGGGGTPASLTASPAAGATAGPDRASPTAPFLEPNGDNSIPTFGAEAPPAERERAEAGLRSYLVARAEGEWVRACAGLAAALVEQLEELGSGGACAAIYGDLAGAAPASSRANPLHGRVVSLRLKGSGGFALFYGPGRQKYVMPLTRETGSWKVTQLVPLPYPGPQLSSP